MVRHLALASVLALLPAAACSQSTEAELDAKASEAEAAAENISEEANDSADIAETPEIGVTVGSSAPNFTLYDSASNALTLADLAGEDGVVLAFTRSAEWCPFCQKQMKELEEAVAPLAAEGWTLASVSYDSPETLAGFAADNSLTYPVLSDTDSATIKAFNLLNGEVDESTRYYGIPHPALVFVRKDGTVAAVLREEGYKDRPPVDVVVSTAQTL